MSPYEMIRAQLGSAVPFARHAGVELVALTEGEGKAVLKQTDVSINHIGSQHAGALFTLGEAASGAAMAGAFAPVILIVRPVAASATINYRKIAKGTITAIAKTSRPGADLRAALDADGKVSFDVDVELADEQERPVADMKVVWHVSKA
ncbi:MAG: DUF4442 domain-containing protein [Parvularculaceae bacterium]